MNLSQSIFDVSPVVARAWAQRGYTPAQIEQARSYKAVRQRLGMGEAPLRLAAPAPAKILPDCPPSIKSADYLAAHRFIDEWKERGEPEPLPKKQLIKRVVAEYFGVTVVDIESDRRTKDVMLPRMTAVYLCRELRLDSFPQIGRSFGGRDHTTAMHSVQKMQARVAADPEFAARVESIKSRIKART